MIPTAAAIVAKPSNSRATADIASRSAARVASWFFRVHSRSGIRGPPGQPMNAHCTLFANGSASALMISTSSPSGSSRTSSRAMRRHSGSNAAMRSGV